VTRDATQQIAYAVEPAPTVGVPIVNADTLFPVRRIYCVGRNYAAHAREMGHDPSREPPFFFCKPADAVVCVKPGEVGVFPYPTGSSEVHFEMELVVAIGRGGRDIPAASALEHVYGYALGLDMTRRDLQAQMKKLGRPWDIAKGFDHAAPLGPIHRAADVGPLERGAIWLEVNGAERQRGDLADMIWSIPETIAYLSRFFELFPGDLIFSGTPDGVGAIERGDVMKGGVDGIGSFEFKVA
jgi:fumarylpyruvate hydrolase